MSVQVAGERRDVEFALRWFRALNRAGVKRVWLRPDLHEQLLRVFELMRPSPPNFVPSVYGVEVLRREDRSVSQI
jgi:hypothetical protein